MSSQSAKIVARILACAVWMPLASGFGWSAEPANIVVGPYLQNPGKTEITVLWIAGGRGEFTIRYGIEKRMDKSVKISKPNGEFSGVPPAYVYEVTLKDLTPGTNYFYAVLSSGKERAGRFSTVPEKPGPWTFIAYGDSRSDPAVHAQVVAGFDRHKPVFILHSGDMVDTGAYEEWPAQYFEPLKPVLDHVPVWPARGNHDGDGTEYGRLYSLPGNEKWYSFNYGNVHVTALDMSANDKAMVAWCANDLAASKAEWKIVLYHKPSYDRGHRKTAWGRQTLLPLFRKHGVDLVLAGHAHGYVRLNPMFTPGENDKHPITYITTAGGGASIDDTPLPPSPYMAAQARQYHFMVFTVDGGRITGQAVSKDGRTLDSFSISKKDGVFDKGYLKQALDERHIDAPAERD